MDQNQESLLVRKEKAPEFSPDEETKGSALPQESLYQMPPDDVELCLEPKSTLMYDLGVTPACDNNGTNAINNKGISDQAMY